MGAQERIDAALDSVLKASGSALRYYTPGTLDKMREAMRKIMSSSYIDGSNDCMKAYTNAQKDIQAKSDRQSDSQINLDLG